MAQFNEHPFTFSKNDKQKPRNKEKRKEITEILIFIHLPLKFTTHERRASVVKAVGCSPDPLPL